MAINHHGPVRGPFRPPSEWVCREPFRLLPCLQGTGVWELRKARAVDRQSTRPPMEKGPCLGIWVPCEYDLRLLIAEFWNVFFFYARIADD